MDSNNKYSQLWKKNFTISETERGHLIVHLAIANRRRTRLYNSLVSGDSLCAIVIPCIGIVYYA